ncbi:class III lanthionine synthetase LanKC [Microbispora sp. RL4-1S]|uniref:non-specific serine/threonine protein kinase n=1 Tax=Microbispora oryzae TaxID=2806554 RepID=A0A940WVV6_9ACTN|nr:class III lanthionine synthetase LanKC [Microbispora oryzae]MBP2708345.1 class III lanthionine synthetase LanKC [Microbispora oryzae]
MNLARHLTFCPPGTPYFDLPTAGVSVDDDFPAATRALEEGWYRTVGTEWVMLMPPKAALPAQGWKIHVSAGLENAARILDVTWDYAVRGGISFKFIRSRKVLMRRNGKYGDRGSSGKFITIYPQDEAHLETILNELGDLLEGEQGPYILSDLRWRSGPLYVRYGGFVALTTRSESGEMVHCVQAPDGRLVPDRRSPGFHPPDWVTMPDCLGESLAARNTGTLQDFPYTVEKALHFSNGGGVYRGVDTRTGGCVLLREARPLAGVDANEEDAVARLKREHQVLDRLSGLPWVPRLVDYRIGYEHYFLVREYVNGEPLVVELGRRNPVCGEGPEDGLVEYTAWALNLLDEIERGIEALHARGVVFGDLHPSNIIVRPDGSPVFIDFETASTDPEVAQLQGAPGFTAPAGYRGPAVDRYALGCLRLALFFPLSTLLPWGPQKIDEVIAFVCAHFPVPEDFAAKVRGDLGPIADLTAVSPAGAARGAFQPSSMTALQDVAEGILATATPERSDRLFPGDAAQFFSPEGGIAFAHGAAGVLWALAETGAEVPVTHIDWLESAARRLDDPALGFYNGLCGIAYALDRLGRTGAALDLLSQVRAQETGRYTDELFGGLAGIGLTHLHFARRTGDRTYLDDAERIAEQIIERPAPSSDRWVPSGLMRGSSGAALLLLQLHTETSELGYLDAAQRLLHSDLRALGWTSEGTWGKGAIGRRTTIAVGAGGTGMVLHSFLTHRFDEQFAQARDAVRSASRRALSRTVSLFQGQTGTILTLLHLGEEPGSPLLAQHLDCLGLHAVRHNGQVAFLGFESIRISTDLATGGAGVLLALDGVITDRRPGLPFM